MAPHVRLSILCTKRALAVVLAGTLLVAGLAGCSGRVTEVPAGASPPAPEPAPKPSAAPTPSPGSTPTPAQQPTVPPGYEFRLKTSFELEGELWTEGASEAISPGGGYTLAVQTSPQATRIVALTLSGDRPAEESVVALHSTSKSQAATRYFGYYPIGWISDTRCVFAVQGTQLAGPNQGKPGVAIHVAGIAPGKAAESTEVAFIPTKDGTTLSSSVHAGKAFLQVPGAIWEFSMADQTLRLVKGELPLTDRYIGQFSPQISPDAKYYMYDRWEDGHAGIYLLDTATGQERLLSGPGESASFYPSWSPDGRFIAAYSVERKKSPAPGVEQYPLNAFDVVYGEEGPLAAGAAITVFDLSGKVIQIVRVEGKWVTHFRWSPDSTHLAFVTGVVVRGQDILPDVEPDEIWMTSVASAPFLLAPVSHRAPAERVYVGIGAVDEDNRGVVYTEFREESITTRRARTGASGAAPDEIAGELDGWEVQRVPGYPSVGIVYSEGMPSVWAMTPEKWARIFASGTGRFLLLAGYNGEVLVVADSPLINWYAYKPGTSVGKTVVRVYRWVKTQS